jgi:hypothetical protein
LPKRAPLQFTSFSRLCEDVSRLRVERRRAGDPRGLVLEQIRAGKDPDAADLANALRQPPPDPATVARVSLTPDEQAGLMTAMESEDSQAEEVWKSTHITEARRAAAIEEARTQFAEDEALLKHYVARAYVLRESPRQMGRKPGRGRTPRRARVYTLAEERQMTVEYFEHARRLQGALDADRSQPRNVKTIAKRRIATKYGISERSVARIIRDLRDVCANNE